ncbi:MAG: hypothetical protein L0K82_07495 [Pisciglobus halotolerans]|nr:hypothetical protein [Pisciglobus halotolerans]
MKDNEILRAVKALEGIEKSLSTLAEDTKANKELKTELYQKMTGFEEILTELKENPFGFESDERD